MQRVTDSALKRPANQGHTSKHKMCVLTACPLLPTPHTSSVLQAGFVEGKEERQGQKSTLLPLLGFESVYVCVCVVYVVCVSGVCVCGVYVLHMCSVCVAYVLCVSGLLSVYMWYVCLWCVTVCEVCSVCGV